MCEAKGLVGQSSEPDWLHYWKWRNYEHSWLQTCREANANDSSANMYFTTGRKANQPMLASHRSGSSQHGRKSPEPDSPLATDSDELSPGVHTPLE